MIGYKLLKEPKGVTIIEGFPGLGLIGTISIEFLLEHFKPEYIGEFIYDELPATIAIHKGQLVRPMSIWYVKKHNLVILHTILNVKEHEWAMADLVNQISEKLKAKEIITIEGVGSQEKTSKAYTFNNEKLEHCGAEPLQESIVVGVSGALMLKSDIVTPLFAGTHSELPDSQAAAKVVEVLNKYLKLNVDFAPLIKQAEKFEEKLKGIMQQSQQAEEAADKKRLDYLG